MKKILAVMLIFCLAVVFTACARTEDSEFNDSSDAVYSDASTERGKKLRKAICEKMHFASLEFQSIEGLIEAIGIDECNLCTYCWTGKE